MGGQGSDMFEYFKILILQGLVAARKHSDKITTLVDVMRAGMEFYKLKQLLLKIFIQFLIQVRNCHVSPVVQPQYKAWNRDFIWIWLKINCIHLWIPWLSNPFILSLPNYTTASSTSPMVFCDDHAEVYTTPNDILTEHFIIIISMGCDFNLKKSKILLIVALFKLSEICFEKMIKIINWAWKDDPKLIFIQQHDCPWWLREDLS